MRKISLLVAGISLTIIVLSLLFHPGLKADGFFTIEGRTMEPSINSSAIVAIEEDYVAADFRRGDLVLFRHPNNNQVFLFKRVIGLPNEAISITNGIVYVNLQPLDEPYIAEIPTYSGNWQVPAGEVFVLSDNRNLGSDSHNWGPLPMDLIIGKGVATCLGQFRLSCVNAIEPIIYEKFE